MGSIYLCYRKVFGKNYPMLENLGVELKNLLQKNLSDSEFSWLSDAIDEIHAVGTSRKLYLNYSLCGNRIKPLATRDFSGVSDNLKNYLRLQEANNIEMARIFMLVSVLGRNTTFVEPVQNLIQIADTSELETFLKYLILLPKPENYQFAAVEALRTNIASVFNAISKYNPFPAKYFTEQQWNQMFLKAAFMQEDLGSFVNIDERANQELARIISDYAHERLAASRCVDPLFWRPVSNFLEGDLLDDIKRLFESENPKERKAAALVCHHSNKEVAAELLNNHPELKSYIRNGSISWETVKN